MYARIRQKLAINYTTTVISNGSGTRALSVLMKDIANLICGNITNVSQLHPSIWDTSNSEVVSQVGGGWQEYQSNYTRTSTNIDVSISTNTNMMYFRTRSLQNTFKYFGIGYPYNTSNNSNAVWNIMYPWRVADFQTDVSLTFRNNNNNSILSTQRQPFNTAYLTEYIIYSSPRVVIVSARNLSNLIAQPYKTVMFLEYPATPLSVPFKLPNQVWWELSTTGVTSSVNAHTFVGGSAYKVPGGYNPPENEDINDNSSNTNWAFVYTPYDVNIGNTSLWRDTSNSTTLSTLKPSMFGTMSSAIKPDGTTQTLPAMPLLHYPQWDTCYDLSSLTGIYGTRSAMGVNGDTLKVNGQNYVYVNTAPMGLLVPRS